jgi:hypothetical protein
MANQRPVIINTNEGSLENIAVQRGVQNLKILIL